ncbi:MAG: hypothetical protein ABJO09_12100 [Hyphomicrobiales bacterium]
MKTIYLFDVDGTLTPARQPIANDFKQFFAGFCERFPVYFITGSDRPKLNEQLPEDLQQAARGIFTCAGTEFWRGKDLVYQRHHEFDEDLVLALEEFVEYSPYPGRFGNHFEYRTGMVNVSVPGRNVPQDGRENYYHWDRAYGERQTFVQKLAKFFPDYSAAAGGQISIDISPRGWTKAQALPRLMNWHPTSRFVFFGDKMNPEGNDRPLADAIWADASDSQAVSVDNPNETKRMLETIYHQVDADQRMSICA